MHRGGKPDTAVRWPLIQILSWLWSTTRVGRGSHPYLHPEPSASCTQGTTTLPSFLGTVASSSPRPGLLRRSRGTSGLYGVEVDDWRFILRLMRPLRYKQRHEVAQALPCGTHTVGLKEELRQQASDYVKRAEAGETS